MKPYRYRCRRCGKGSLECLCITTAGLRLLSAKELRRMLRWADTVLRPLHIRPPTKEDPMSDIMPYNHVIGTLLANPDARQAVLYLSPKRTVRATRKRYRCLGGKPNKRVIEVVLTDGPPNYQEREFIRKCKKAGEPFPVKKVQVR